MSDPEPEPERAASNERLYKLTMKALLALTVLGAIDTFVPRDAWGKIPTMLANMLATPEPAPEPSPSTSPSPSPSPTPSPPRPVQPPPPPVEPEPLPEPLPEPRVVEATRPFTPGAVYKGDDGAVVDPAAGLVHVAAAHARALQAIEPQSGDTVYTHAAGDLPLAVAGNRLLAASDGRLWLLDTADGTPVAEVPLPQLPPMGDEAWGKSRVEVEQHAGSVVVVLVHAQQQIPHEEGNRVRYEQRIQEWLFGVDLATGRVVPCPDDAEPAPFGRVDGVKFYVTGHALQAHEPDEHVQGPPPRWRLGLTRVFGRATEPRPPLPLLPEPWPEPSPADAGQPFEPGPARRMTGWGALADPTRGVFHLMLPDGLCALDPETGETVYAHEQGVQPIALVGNRLLARDDGALWVLDTHDGAAVYALTSPHFPPLLNEGGRYARVYAIHGRDSVLLVETHWSEPAPEEQEGVERAPRVERNYRFGLDLASGRVVPPPEVKPQQLPLREGRSTRQHYLRTTNLQVRGRRSYGDMDDLWTRTLRDLTVREPPQVEQPEGR